MEQEQAEERKAKVIRMRSILRDALIVAPSMLKLLIILFFALECSESGLEKLSQEELFWSTKKENMLDTLFCSLVALNQDLYQDMDQDQDGCRTVLHF